MLTFHTSRHQSHHNVLKHEAMILTHLLWLLLIPQQTNGLLLLNELPTPAFVLDVQSMQRHVDSCTGEKNSAIPSILLSSTAATVVSADPIIIKGGKEEGPHTFDPSQEPISILESTRHPICYLHSRVVRGRDQSDANSNSNNDSSTFLAEIDLVDTNGAQLCLGLNNHHVGSYYWARSAGSGAAMEAPGVLYTAESDGGDGNTGVLQWEAAGGPQECNSNDGKRSEWVNFLRINDNVQLVPLEVEASLIEFLAQGRVFGVSSTGRPLGSEPQVVCEWKAVSPGKMV